MSNLKHSDCIFLNISNCVGWAMPNFCWTTRSLYKWSRYSCSIEVGNFVPWQYARSKSIYCLNFVRIFLIFFLDYFSSITGNFSYQPCYHGNFLGAILGTGIAREKLGDIIVQVYFNLCLIFYLSFLPLGRVYAWKIEYWKFNINLKVNSFIFINRICSSTQFIWT